MTKSESNKLVRGPTIHWTCRSWTFYSVLHLWKELWRKNLFWTGLLWSVVVDIVKELENTNLGEPLSPKANFILKSLSQKHRKESVQQGHGVLWSSSLWGVTRPHLFSLAAAVARCSDSMLKQHMKPGLKNSNIPLASPFSEQCLR